MENTILQMFPSGHRAVSSATDWQKASCCSTSAGEIRVVRSIKTSKERGALF